MDRPDAVKELHYEFLHAGSDVMVAFTYYGHRSKMKVVDKEDRLEELNRQALRIAREVAESGDALLAGNICNTWEYDPEDHEGSFRVIRPIFEEQVQWAQEEGVDFILGETFSHLGEAKLALEVIKEAKLPAVIAFTPNCDTTLDGYSWHEACARLEDHGADVVGLNCGRGPATTWDYLKQIRKAVKTHVAAVPVPYRTNAEHPYFQDLRLEDGSRAIDIYCLGS